MEPEEAAREGERIKTRPHPRRGPLIAIAGVLVAIAAVATVLVVANSAGNAPKTATKKLTAWDADQAAKQAAHDKKSESSPSVGDADDGPAVPSGFRGVIGGVAYTWVGDDAKVRSVCGALYSDGCNVLRVQPVTGACSRVYAAANIVDGEDVVLDSTNDISGSLEVGESAYLRMVYSGGAGAVKIKLTTLACY